MSTIQVLTSRPEGLACSLITMSVVSARGRLTREAIVVESVSMMILEHDGERNINLAMATQGVQCKELTHHQSSRLDIRAPCRGSPELTVFQLGSEVAWRQRRRTPVTLYLT